MESVIKQGQEAVSMAESRSLSLYKDYEPLKVELNSLRKEVGLEPVHDDAELDKLDVPALTQTGSYSRYALA